MKDREWIGILCLGSAGALTYVLIAEPLTGSELILQIAAFLEQSVFVAIGAIFATVGVLAGFGVLLLITSMHR